MNGLDPCEVLPQEPLQAPRLRVVPLYKPRARVHLSLPPDLPDYNPYDGDRSLERTLAIARITEAICLAVAIAVLTMGILALLFAAAPAAAT